MAQGFNNEIFARPQGIAPIEDGNGEVGEVEEAVNSWTNTVFFNFASVSGSIRTASLLYVKLETETQANKVARYEELLARTLAHLQKVLEDLAEVIAEIREQDEGGLAEAVFERLVEKEHKGKRIKDHAVREGKAELPLNSLDDLCHLVQRDADDHDYDIEFVLSEDAQAEEDFADV